MSVIHYGGCHVRRSGSSRRKHRSSSSRRHHSYGGSSSSGESEAKQAAYLAQQIAQRDMIIRMEGPATLATALGYSQSPEKVLEDKVLTVWYSRK